MDLEPYLIPRHLDAPPRIVFWTVDEWLTALGPFGLMAANGHSILGLMVSGAAWWGLKKIKSRNGGRVLQRLLYWHSPPVLFPNLPPSYRRRYFG